MSSTLKERIEKLRVGTGFPNWSSDVKRLILSEAHRIGTEAINAERDLVFSDKVPENLEAFMRSVVATRERLRKEQRQRLRELTGVKE